jgi:hypothetical protein
MKVSAAFAIILTLAACGADGPPMRPTASIGLNIGPGGVSTSCNVGGSNGTVTIGVAC